MRAFRQDRPCERIGPAQLTELGPKLAVLQFRLLQGLTNLPRPLVFVPLLRTGLSEPFEQPSPVHAPLACLLGWSNTLQKPECGPPLQLEKLLHIAKIQHSRLGLFEGRDDGSDSSPLVLHLRYLARPPGLLCDAFLRF
jgi:hypothetical protein